MNHCVYYVPVYARSQIFIQLSPTVTKLCHIKCDYLVHVMCAKCPPSAEMHAFRRLQKSIALLIIVCGKSSQICCSVFLALGWSLALTEVCEMLEASHPTHGSGVVEVW